MNFAAFDNYWHLQRTSNNPEKCESGINVDLALFSDAVPGLDRTERSLGIAHRTSQLLVQLLIQTGGKNKTFPIFIHSHF